MLVTYAIAPQNTGQEFDGSDSGARPDEAISWGKIRAGSESVKVCALDPSKVSLCLTESS